ncbi:MAG: DUF4411 family protein [Candidatus Hydrogenedentes bacterium]|nr:DUF4411 family protein [Candidatus Hydrogenedentota bacterium]
MTVDHSNPIYCLDADALINIQMYYPEALKQLNRYAKDGKVVIPEGVYREICRKSDRLNTMVQAWHEKHSAVIRLDTPTLRVELARMEGSYGEKINLGKQRRKGFWSSRSGKLSADSQVVAVCKINKYIAVSNVSKAKRCSSSS